MVLVIPEVGFVGANDLIPCKTLLKISVPISEDRAKLFVHMQSLTDRLRARDRFPRQPSGRHRLRLEKEMATGQKRKESEVENPSLG